MKRAILAGLVVLTAIVAAACSGGSKGGGGGPGSAALAGMTPGAFDTTANAAAFAAAASAADAFYFGIFPGAIASAGIDPNCPHVATSGSTKTITGGCTDQSGNSYDGKVVVSGGSPGSPIGGYSYQGWKISVTDSCNTGTFTNVSTFDGTFTASGSTASTTYGSDLKVVIMGADTSCAPVQSMLAWNYHGTMTATGPDTNGDGVPDTLEFNGSGKVGLTATIGGTVVPGLGSVDATTAQEQVNQNTCQSEALSGTTTIKANNHTAVITYDGAATCDTSGTATWTYDGTPRGEIAVGCDVGGDVGSAAGMLASIGSGCALLLRRRKRRS